jgi:hypothetical protein
MRYTLILLVAVTGCKATGTQSGSDAGATNDLADAPSFDLGSAPDFAAGAAPRWIQQSVSGFNVGSFSDLWGSSPSDIWAVGTGGNQAGYAYHSPGGGVWTETKSTGPLYAVWGTGPSEIYLAGLDMILHSIDAGATWQKETLPTVAGSWLIDALWGSGANDIYAAGISTNASGTTVGSSILHSTGNGTWVSQYSDGNGSSFSVWGADKSHVYAVDRHTGAVARSSGNGSWTAYGALGASGSIWGLGAGQLFVSGSSGTLFQSADATSWTPQRIASAGTEQLENVWGGASSDLFVVGNQGSIFHNGGAGWSKEGVGGAKLTAVWGSGSDVYVAGVDGIYHRE